MIRIGIVGTGFGSTQIKSFKGIEGAEVAGLAGRDFEKTRSIAEQFSVPKVYKSHLELFADSEIDLVSIATPNNLHKQMFADAVAANKHIILEKPAGLNSLEIKEMIDLSGDYSKLIVVDHPLRFNPVTREILQIVKSGKIGEISLISISAFTNYVSDKAKETIWIDTKEAGGGQTLNMGTHLLDLIRFLSGMSKLKRGHLVKATPIKSYPDGGIPEIEQQITANLQLDNGVNGHFFNTTASFGYRNFEIKVMGSQGIIFYDENLGLRISLSNEQELTQVEVVDSLISIDAGRSFVSKSFKFFARELIDYLNSKTEKSDFCSLQEAYENMLILEKISA